MAHVVILDDRIDPSLLRPDIAFESFDFAAPAPGEPTADTPSHGSTCAMILQQNTGAMRLTGIQVLSSARMPSSIEPLKEALGFCLTLHPDVVHMSIGTDRLSDVDALQPAFDALLASGAIIVAALANSRLRCVPASLEGVIGVQSDKRGLLAPGQMLYLPDDPLRTQFVINSAVAAQVPGYDRSNSFAAPLVSARVNSLCNRGITGYAAVMDALIDQCVEHPAAQKTYTAYPPAGPVCIPCVAIRGFAHVSGSAPAREIPAWILSEYGFETCILAHESLLCHDMRGFALQGDMPLDRVLCAVQEDTTADLAVCLLRDGDPVPAPHVDLLIDIDQTAVRYLDPHDGNCLLHRLPLTQPPAWHDVLAPAVRILRE